MSTAQKPNRLRLRLPRPPPPRSRGHRPRGRSRSSRRLLRHRGRDGAGRCARGGRSVVVPDRRRPDPRESRRSRASTASSSDRWTCSTRSRSTRSPSGSLASGRPLHILVEQRRDHDGAAVARRARATSRSSRRTTSGTSSSRPAVARARNGAGRARRERLRRRRHRHSRDRLGRPELRAPPVRQVAAYGQSKTANNLFALEVDQRGQANGIRAFAVHPGQHRHTVPAHTSARGAAGARLVDETATSSIREHEDARAGRGDGVWCATSPQLDGLGGVYCENCDIAALFPARRPPSGRATVEGDPAVRFEAPGRHALLSRPRISYPTLGTQHATHRRRPKAAPVAVQQATTNLERAVLAHDHPRGSASLNNAHLVIERDGTTAARNGLPKPNSLQLQRRYEGQRGDDGTRTHDPLLAILIERSSADPLRTRNCRSAHFVDNVERPPTTASARFTRG